MGEMDDKNIVKVLLWMSIDNNKKASFVANERHGRCCYYISAVVQYKRFPQVLPPCLTSLVTSLRDTILISSSGY